MFADSDEAREISQFVKIYLENAEYAKMNGLAQAFFRTPSP